MNPNVSQHYRNNTYQELEGTKYYYELAKKWAINPENIPVEGGEFSSYHYSIKAGDYATSAKKSEELAIESSVAANSSAEAALNSAMDAESSKASAETSAEEAAHILEGVSEIADQIHDVEEAVKKAEEAQKAAEEAARLAKNSEGEAENSSTSAETSAKEAEDALKGTQDLYKDLKDSYRDAGGWDNTQNSLPSKPNPQVPTMWVALGNNAPNDPLRFNQGEGLLYSPELDPDYPNSGPEAGFFKRSGETLAPLPPTDVEILEDLIMQQGKRIYFKKVNDDLVETLQLDIDEDVIVGSMKPSTRALGQAKKLGLAAEKLFHIKEMSEAGEAIISYPIVTEEGGEVLRKKDNIPSFYESRNTSLNQFAASGFVHYGKHFEGLGSINEGLWVRGSLANDSNHLYMGSDSGAGTSKTDMPVIHVAGIIFDIVNLQRDDSLYNTVKLPEAPDGTVTHNSATGEVIQHADAATAFALADTSDDVEVVINRVDMFGAEFFLEEVSQTNSFVYPKGMIQSQATSMNGINTTTSNRPASYYAVYDGDTSSQGRGVDFWSSTDEQKKELVSDKSNNIFMMADGRVVQWRMRQRTVAGTGNGDWKNVNSASDDLLRYGSGALHSVKPQGVLDNPRNTTSDYFAPTSRTDLNSKPHQGVFTTSISSGSAHAINGECYFHVWGTCERLNQGAYHPSFNALGTATWRQDGVGYAKWYDRITGFDGYHSTAMCFEYANGVTGVYGGQIGTPNNGIGRDDKRLYDAIYEGGQGGVTDLRLSAWDMGPKEEAAKVFQKVVNGTYRGEEKLVRTEISHRDTVHAPFWDSTNGTAIWVEGINDKRQNLNLNMKHCLINGYQCNFTAEDGNGQYVYIQPRYGDVSSYFSDKEWLAFTFPSEFSVSGEFTMVDVIGDPANILALPELANGWLGGWIPVINDGGSKTYPLTRKAVDFISSNNPDAVYWNGSSWIQFSNTDGWNWNGTTNSYESVTFGSQNVFLNTYKAFAKQTKESTRKPVFNSEEGVGDVYASGGYWSSAWGNLFLESLLGKVGTSSTAGSGGSRYKVNQLTLRGDNDFINNSANDPTLHVPIGTQAPDNDSPAVKALWYQTSDNGQVGLNFAYNELIWDATPYVDIDGETSQPYTSGVLYRVDTGFGRVGVVSATTSTQRFNSYTLLADGNYYDASGVLRFYAAQSVSGSWGDDSTVRITDDQSTYTNLNGDTCLYGSNELALPYGYSKNQARVSKQVRGIDL